METAPGWMISCTTCGHARNASDAGLVRLGAPRRSRKMTLGSCSKCGRLRWLRVWHVSHPEGHQLGGVGRQLTLIYGIVGTALGVGFLAMGLVKEPKLLLTGAIAFGVGLVLLLVSRIFPGAKRMGEGAGS